MIRGREANEIFVTKNFEYPPHCRRCRCKFRGRETAAFDGMNFYCPFHAPEGADEIEIPSKYPYYQERA